MIEIVKNWNFSKKDCVKAGLATKTLNKLNEKERTLKITGVLLFNKINEETGEVKAVTAFKQDNGIVTSTSLTVRDSAQMIAETFGDDLSTGLEIKVIKETSNNEREFFLIDLV